MKGQWQNLDGQSRCKVCADGTYAPTVGSTSCKDDCGAGSYINDEKTACSLCIKGRYQDLKDQQSCKICVDGTYAPTVGSTSYKDDCGAGFYITADKSACSACEFGQYQDLEDQSTCRNDCSAGSYITADRTACSLCAFGQYQDQSGQSECKNDCEIGFYANDKACSTECPQGYSGIRDLRSCVKDCVYTDGSVSNLLSISNKSNICACGKKHCTNETGYLCIGAGSLCTRARTECNLNSISFDAEYCEVITDKCLCSKCTKSYHTSECIKCKKMHFIFDVASLLSSCISF